MRKDQAKMVRTATTLRCCCCSVVVMAGCGNAITSTLPTALPTEPTSGAAQTNWTVVEGYLVDNYCADEGPGWTSPDGIDVFEAPEKHSLSCLMMDACYTSGFVVMAGGKSVYSLTSSENTDMRKWLSTTMITSGFTAAQQLEVTGLRVAVRVYDGNDAAQTNVVEPKCWLAAAGSTASQCTAGGEGGTSDENGKDEPATKKANLAMVVVIAIAVSMAVVGGAFIACRKGLSSANPQAVHSNQAYVGMENDMVSSADA